MDTAFTSNLPSPKLMSLQIIFSILAIHFTWDEDSISHSHFLKDLALVQFCNHSPFILWRLYLFYKKLCSTHCLVTDSQMEIHEKLDNVLQSKQSPYFVFHLDMTALQIPFDYFQFLLDLPLGIANSFGLISQYDILDTFTIFKLLDFPEIGMIQIFDYYQDIDLNTWCKLFDMAYHQNCILFCQYLAAIKLKVPCDNKLITTENFPISKVIFSVKSFFKITRKHFVRNCDHLSCLICRRKNIIDSISEQFRTIRKYSIRQINVSSESKFCMCWTCNTDFHTKFNPMEFFTPNLVIQSPHICDLPPPSTPEVWIRFYAWFMFRHVSDTFEDDKRYNFTVIARSQSYLTHQTIINIYNAKTDLDFDLLRTWHNGVRQS